MCVCMHTCVHGRISKRFCVDNKVYKFGKICQKENRYFALLCPDLTISPMIFRDDNEKTKNKSIPKICNFFLMELNQIKYSIFTNSQ